MRSTKRLIGACVAAMLVWATAPADAATTCKDDSACAKDEHCEKVPCAVAPCEPGTECPPVSCPDEGTCEPNGPGSSCSEDANCPSGFVCEVVGASSCAAPGCEPGQECPPAPPCEPEEISACVPAPCESDDECGEGLSCITFTQKDCPDAAPVSCAPGGDCPPPEPAPECQETSKSMCAPPYVAPCQVAADCGEGFDCEPLEQCTCSAGAATPSDDPDDEPSSDDGAADPMPPADDEQCTCTPSGDNVCVPKEIDCKVDGECPDGWTCEASAVSTCIAPPPDSEPGSDVPDPCEPIEPTSYCVPPAWNDWGWGDSSGASSYEEALARATGSQDAVTAEAPEAPAPPDDQDKDSGCAVAGTDGSAPTMLLLLLAVLAVIFRRRSSR